MGARVTDPWTTKHGLEYAVLRLALDDRPPWMRALGLREVAVSGTLVVSRVPPRLRYARKIGSFAVLPYDSEEDRSRDAATADERLAALRRMRGELLATPAGPGTPGPRE
jgi:hypothetical protein